MPLEYFSQEARQAYTAAVQQACRGLAEEGHPDDPEQDWRTVAQRVVIEHLDRYFAFVVSEGEIIYLSQKLYRGNLKTTIMRMKPEVFLKNKGLFKMDLWLQRGRNLTRKPLTANDQLDMWMQGTEIGSYAAQALVPPGHPEFPDGETPDEVFNLYSGPGISREEAVENKEMWEMYRRHMLENIADGDDVAGEFLIASQACMVQRPGEKQCLIVFIGGHEGSGKSQVVDSLRAIIGNRYCPVPAAEDIFGKTPVILTKAILIHLAEESCGSHKKGQQARLKTIASDRDQTIRRLYMEPDDYEIIANLWCTSNDLWLVNMNKWSRRKKTYRANDNLIKWKAAKNADWDLWKRTFTTTEGLRAIAYGLYNYDLSNFDHRDVPRTRIEEEQILQSLGGIHRWIYGEFVRYEKKPCKKRGMAPSDFFGSRISKDRLYRRCVESAIWRRQGLNTPDEGTFWKRMREVMNIKEDRKGSSKRFVTLPDPASAAQTFSEFVGADPMPNINWKKYLPEDQSSESESEESDDDSGASACSEPDYSVSESETSDSD